ncbi:hypothetical protein CNMCM8980_007243 [Aspergillus fumigatiaffinis]|uniref:Uncharacterized protein n=1 Tax=Aspergillus fumigatiaffinis TaxID=340414 RepID=A0A8H4GV39_9EURO|nr:hypothetical protein CNMCM5878_006946 [Aspergillus fumigatiaffinis]KAF4229180.1 hypothetical protein CNMCM6457_006526 [Aspergillus fumigatiaffinis]KAF4237176.1 hypothetical protein CNMCM6805_007125 [Aspergillus fumigatiaffinis]KAF4247471.1 hypothetical protein CNMCM8980_007243 [Aspergillus fumigatiaffinis]
MVLMRFSGLSQASTVQLRDMPRFSKLRSDRCVFEDRILRSGTSLFSISSKSAKYNGAVVTPHEFGSGLMSERGYDSDAQFISTPIHIADNVKAAASIGRKGALPAQPYRNEGNSLLAKDDKCPVYQHTEVSLSSPEHEGWSPQAMHGFFISHEPNVQSPKARGSHRPSASLNNGASSGENNGNCGLVPIASASAASLNIFESKEIIPPTLQEQPGSPGCGSNTPLHTFNLVSPSTERSSELLITKRRRHQESTCEDQSIHLADLDISKMLASASTSPVILSPSQSSYENPHGSTSGTWGAQYQGGRFGSPARILTPVWDGGVLKLGVQDARQASSCYSPRTSSASADVPANLEKTNMNQNKREISCSRTLFAALSPNASSRSVSLSEKHVPSLDCGSLCKTDALKSRFTEQFDLNRSITSLGSVAMSNGVTSPRKVSIGWMSGGRRLGYGYTVVDGDRDETAGKDSGKASSTRWESPTKPHIAHIIDRLRVSRWSGATALIRPSNASDSARCDSVVNSRTWRSCEYAIGRKKGAQTMKLRSPSRKRCRDTASDGVSMSSSQHTVKEENSLSTSQDKKGRIISQDAFERPAVQHSHADNEENLQCDDPESTLDDWASMYQDCLELYSDPE